jgi:fibrillarin-like pre-rRNA processing protein
MMDSMALRQIFPGVYLIDNRLATLNLARGFKVYGEDLIVIDGIEYRLWNPYRSKLAAAMKVGMRNFGIRTGDRVLYLGAATGTTASHVSDIVGKEGRVYGLELSERNMRDFIGVCEHRSNMLPILADARYTDSYSGTVDMCDVIYQDVSARDQAHILLENSRFLKKGGLAYFIIKSQSVDISKKPEEVYRNVLERLKGKFMVLERMSLEPYDSLHLFTVLRKI